MEAQYTSSVLSLIGIHMILVCSLNLLSGYAGLVSLGHAAILGIAAYTSALASARYGLPFAADLPLSVLVTAALAAVLGLPSLRVRDDFFVLTTIGMNFVVVAVFRYVDFFGGALGILGIPPAAVGSLRFAGPNFLILVGAGLAVTLLAMRALLRSWFGMGLHALREDALAAESVGVPVARTKILCFAASGAIAGLAGSLYAHFVGSLFPDHFEFTASVTALAMLVFGGERTLMGPLLGALLLGAATEVLRFLRDYRMTFYGGILVLTVLLQPMGLAGQGSALASLWKRLRRPAPLPVPAASAVAGMPRPEPDGPPFPTPDRAEVGGAMGSAGRPVDRPPILEVRGVVKRFGGLEAVAGVSLTVQPGEILAVIGPNGAGKTTLFNVIAGALAPTAGEVYVRGRRTTGLPPHRMAALGVARTFQLTRPFGGLSVLDNVLAGLGWQHYSSPLRAALARCRTPANLARAAALLETAHLPARYWAEPAGALPVGLRRRLEIARALALQPRLLLLDEPAAGLTPAEIDDLAAVLRDLNARGGLTLIVIEHNVPFALGLAHRTLVLNQGRVLALGTPEDVRQDPAVAEVYLGR